MKLAVREDAASALPLLREVLRDGGELAPEYPLVFSEGGRGRVVVAEEQGEVISGCAVLEHDLVLPGAELRAGLIGSVATAAGHRGRGLASAVLARAEEELRSRGCLFAMLWADSAAYYEARGYRAVGAERDFLIGVETGAGLPSAGDVRLARPTDFARMHALYDRHSRRVHRSPAESAALFATPGMETLVFVRDGEPEAYTCRGRGRDLEDVVHEWAGEPEAVLACLHSNLEAVAPGDLILMSPPGPNAVAQRLEQLGVPSAVGVLGMGKLLDIAAALELLGEASSAELECVSEPSGASRVRRAGRSVELAPEELLEALLPAHARCLLLEELERELGTSFARLPLAPFLWGLDSI